MVEPDILIDSDFQAQMEALAIEAEHIQKPKPKAGVVDVVEAAQAPSEPSLSQMLRPVVAGIEALTRAQSSHVKSIERLEKAAEATATVPTLLAEAKHAVEQRNVVNRAMFEALHSELKAYRDDFMLDAVLRPILRDLITLYDDTLVICQQAQLLSSYAADEVSHDRLATLHVNLDHHTHFVLEVLERMEVTQIPSFSGKLNKRTQRVVAIEEANDPDEDRTVARVVRRGFQWRDRVVRPEEVVIKAIKRKGEIAGAGVICEPDSARSAPGGAIGPIPSDSKSPIEETVPPG
jgi:molecular chaperone GrpE (heat shock protein)